MPWKRVPTMAPGKQWVRVSWTRSTTWCSDRPEMISRNVPAHHGLYERTPSTTRRRRCCDVTHAGRSPSLNEWNRLPVYPPALITSSGASCRTSHSFFSSSGRATRSRTSGILSMIRRSHLRGYGRTLSSGGDEAFRLGCWPGGGKSRSDRDAASVRTSPDMKHTSVWTLERSQQMVWSPMDEHGEFTWFTGGGDPLDDVDEFAAKKPTTSTPCGASTKTRGA
nr:unnamed protein product [Digitaria exilis]